MQLNTVVSVFISLRGSGKSVFNEDMKRVPMEINYLGVLLSEWDERLKLRFMEFDID